MQSATQFKEERAELEALLSSGIFARSPSLATFLQYVCERYFEGQANSIKEYNVAVEALGRPANFDQKRDSIVRVEAHRLRKRLHHYYADQGSTHPIQISIPPGNYIPQFVRKADLVDVAEVLNGHAQLSESSGRDIVRSLPLAAVGERSTERRRDRTPLVLMAIALVLVSVVAAWFVMNVGRSAAKPAAVENIEPLLANTPQDEVRILTGSKTPKMVDHYGNTW